jgi:hypothetical protein
VVALEGILLFKGLDEDGGIAYYEQWTRGLHPIDGLGMLDTAQETFRRRVWGNAKGIR